MDPRGGVLDTPQVRGGSVTGTIVIPQWAGRKICMEWQSGVTPWSRDPGTAETSNELP